MLRANDDDTDDNSKCLISLFTTKTTKTFCFANDKKVSQNISSTKTNNTTEIYHCYVS